MVCADEIPNLKVSERNPIRQAFPGHIEHQEFEYTRYGPVSLLVFLVVHTGRMERAVLGLTTRPTTSRRCGSSGDATVGSRGCS